MSEASPSPLVLIGRVKAGAGLFRKELKLPANLLNGQLWIREFVQGTLNIKFEAADLPSQLQENGLIGLDLNPDFKPAIYRAGKDIPDNTIRPNLEQPKLGDIQLWRATLKRLADGSEHRCFVIRRVGSGYRYVAEVLGEQDFRCSCGFSEGEALCLVVYSSNS